MSDYEREVLKRVVAGDFSIWDGTKPPEHMIPLLNRLKDQPSQKDGLDAIRQILSILGSMNEYRKKADCAEARLAQMCDYLGY